MPLVAHPGFPYNTAVESAAAAVVRGIESVIVEGPRTPDMGGTAGTSEVGAAVADALRAQSKVHRA